MTAPVFGITGWKNSGKTTLTERLVTEIASRGFRVSTVKHAHHDFDIDQPGTDSHRHRMAGAGEVAIVSARRYAIMHELRAEQEPAMEAVIARLAPCDLVLVEGYKREKHAKLEVRRAAARSREPLAPGDPTICAIVADHQIADAPLPVFDIDAIGEIADFVLRSCALPPRRN